MRNVKVLLSLAVWIVTIQSAWSQTLTIDSCYEKARRNYPLIKQYGLIEKSTEYTLSNAGKSYLPQLSVTGIAGYIIKGLPSIGPGSEAEDKFQFIGIGQLNQTLWDGGATHAQKEIIKADANVQKAEVDVAMYDLYERVNQLYFSILLMDEQLQLLTILTENLNRNLKAVKLSSENGLAYSSDVDEVKVEILKVEQRITETRFARDGYVAMLSLLIGEPLPASIKVEKPIVESGLDQFAFKRPELSLYEYKRSQMNAQQSLTKVGYMPKVGLLAAGILVQPGFAFGPEKVNSLALAGLSVSWNTSGLYKSKNDREINSINLERINNQQETFVFNTNLELTQQRSEVQKQKTIVEKDAEIVTLKTSIKKSYELKYQNGMCSMNELLIATNGEAEALGNKALHETQLAMSIYSYKTTSGN